MRGLERVSSLFKSKKEPEGLSPRPWMLSSRHVHVAALTAEELRTADTHPHLRIKSIVFEKKEINFIFSTLKKIEPAINFCWENATFGVYNM